MALERRPLFEIPYWRLDLPSVRPFHSEMTREVEDQIDRELRDGRDNPFTAHQTHADPFELPSLGWSRLDDALREALTEIASTTFRRQTEGEFHLRRWAIRYGRLSDKDKERLRRDAVHNHMPALLSSLYYLSVPADLPEGKAGTRFLSPLGGHLQFVAAPEVVVGGSEGELLIFPAQLDHSTCVIDWDATERSRIVIVTDLYYVHGFQNRGSDGRVVRV